MRVVFIVLQVSLDLFVNNVEKTNIPIDGLINSFKSYSKIGITIIFDGATIFVACMWLF